MRKLLTAWLSRTCHGAAIKMSIYFMCGFSFVGCSQEQKIDTDLVAWQLRAIVKEIEFYKIVNGAYPGTLKELSREGEALETIDPLASNSGSACSYYYVRNETQDRYILRSVGLDGALLTDDDIIPDLEDAEIGKIGWVSKFSDDFEYLEPTCGARS